MKKKPPQPLSAWRPFNLDNFILGVAHYPEHVNESYWERDAARMAEAGFNAVRMGEFAWHIWEPRESCFDFDLFDRAVEVLARHGIRTILCTPTATPPRWLTMAHPEVLRVDANGRRATHGSRQHADTTSPVLRGHSRRITRALAEHYKENPSIIGWQTDNELNHTSPVSFSKSCGVEFRNWCRAKYGTIAALNSAWGGDFWATHYGDFHEVELPWPLNPGHVSPGHRQDYHRFLADATAAFQRDQVEILRKANPDWFVFHNLGRIDDVDPRGEFGRDLDFLGFDIYPMLYDEMRRSGGHAHMQALHLDVCRAYGGNFIVPEQASGLGSQPTFSTMTPEPGEMHRMALSSVARGADGVMFFRWRPAHYGAEIYWMGLVDHDDVPRRRYAEAKKFSSDIASIKEALLGTVVRMDVGIAGADFDNQEAYRAYPMGLPSPLEDATILHRELYMRGIATGFIHPEDDLSRVKALYVPHWVMWDESWTAKVGTFVERGGILIASAMTATRTKDNHIPSELAPCLGLSDLFGVKVEEFGRLAPPEANGLFVVPEPPPGFGPDALKPPASSTNRRHMIRFGEGEFTAAHLYERLSTEHGNEVLATWSDRWLAGETVVSRRKRGRGAAIYVGTYLTQDLAARLVDAVIVSAGISPLLPDLPKAVEVSERHDQDGRRLLFVLNTGSEEAELVLPGTFHDLLQGRDVCGQVLLDGYSSLVLRA